MSDEKKKSEVKELKQVPANRNVYQRISDVMQDVGYLQKDKEVGTQYKSVSFGMFAAKTREALLKHGLIVIPTIERSEVRHLVSWVKKTNSDGKVWKDQDAFRTELLVVLRIQNIDNAEDFFEMTTFGAGVDEQDKDPGKALTYSLKHGLMKLLLIETGEGEESPFTPPDAETLSEEQTKKIRDLAAEAKISEEKITASVGVQKFDEIPVSKYEELVVGLNQRVARLKEKEATKDKGEEKPKSEKPTASEKSAG